MNMFYVTLYKDSSASLRPGNAGHSRFGRTVVDISTWIAVI